MGMSEDMSQRLHLHYSLIKGACVSGISTLPVILVCVITGNQVRYERRRDEKSNFHDGASICVLGKGSSNTEGRIYVARGGEYKRVFLIVIC